MELGSIPRRVRRADATVTNFDRVDVRTVGDYTPAAGEAVPGGVEGLATAVAGQHAQGAQGHHGKR